MIDFFVHSFNTLSHGLLGYAIPFLFVLTIVVFFHELGHFWVARKLGMKVEEFAIGMGPKLYSFVRNGIVYSIRWIPAGGFVKLPQMITSEALEGKSDEPVPLAPPFHKIFFDEAISKRRLARRRTLAGDWSVRIR